MSASLPRKPLLLGWYQLFGEVGRRGLLIPDLLEPWGGTRGPTELGLTPFAPSWVGRTIWTISSLAP